MDKGEHMSFGSEIILKFNVQLHKHRMSTTRNFPASDDTEAVFGI